MRKGQNVLVKGRFGVWHGVVTDDELPSGFGKDSPFNKLQHAYTMVKPKMPGRGWSRTSVPIKSELLALEN